MEETDRVLTADEGEETMVAPRFDDEETVLARPVVPLEDVGADAVPARDAAVNAPLYSRLRNRPRRSLVAALVVVSALAGGVLGGAGLYLYQKNRQAAPAVQQQAEAPAQQQAAAEPAPESAKPQPVSETKQPQASEPAAPKADAAADGVDDDGAPSDARPAEAESAPPVERRRASEAPDATSNTKRGKKGERDEEIARAPRRANRDDDDESYRDEASGRAPVARRVGVITYRPRRARARRDSDGSADRLRRIFEGQP
jgi:hypothetical protein